MSPRHPLFQVICAFPTSLNVLLLFAISVAPPARAQVPPLFLPVATYPSGGVAPYSVVIADVNNDGKPDIVVANYWSSTFNPEGGVAVSLGNGDGTFQPAGTYRSGGGAARSLAVADVNGDGRPDILVTSECVPISYCNGSIADGGVGVLLGNGDGTFQPAVVYDSGGVDAMSVAVADLNGDGKPDIVVANLIGGSVGLLFGNGAGSFQPVVTFSIPWTNLSAVTVADLNADGRPDLVFATSSTGGLYVALGNGDGTFARAIGHGTGGVAVSVAVADVNGDGKPDLLAANFCTMQTNFACSDGSVGVLLGNGDGTFRPFKTYKVGGAATESLAVADVNGDGIPDVVAADCAPKEYSGCNAFVHGRVGVLLGNGDGTFRNAVTYDAGGPNVISIAAGDLRHSGRPDVVIAAARVGVLLNNTGVKSSTSTTLDSSLNPSIYGQKVIFTAVVTSTGPLPPRGIVAFTWKYFTETFTIGTATLNSSGVATLTRSNLNADPYPLTAAYKGDASNAPSTSPVLSQTVLQTTSKAAITSSPNPSIVGQAVTFTAKITSPTVMPTGPVTLTLGQTTLGTGQLSGGKATFTTSSLPSGSNVVKVTYLGDSNIAKSSAAVTQVVQP